LSSSAQAAHRAVVQLLDQHGNRAVQLGQGEEPLMAQPRQDPALHHLHADLDLGLVARLVGAGRHNRRAVVPRHLAIRPVHRRLVKAGAGDAGLEVVTHHLARDAAEVGERAHVRADPVRQRLSPDSTGVGEARRAQHGDKDLRLTLLPACPLHHRHRAAGKVDEQTLASRMHLAQRGLQPAGPLTIQVAEPGIAEPVRRSRAILLPQQGQRHVGSAQLPVHPHPVRHRAAVHRNVRHGREQQRLQPLVVEPVRQRPAQPRPPCPAHVAVHRAQTQSQALRNHALRQTLSEVQPQDLTYVPHRHSLTWHPCPLLLGRDKATLG